MEGEKVLEIGGYFEFETFHGEPFHANAIPLDCARSALVYLAELRDIKRIWLPDYMCSVIPETCSSIGIVPCVYSVGTEFQPVFDFQMKKGDYLLLADYFGQLKSSTVDTANDLSSGRLVVDETQGFFRQPWQQADTFYSCRKYFGVSDGGYLQTKDGFGLERELLRSESFESMHYMLGRYERPASQFFAESRDNEKRFDGRRLARGMSKLTANILNAIDYPSVARRRERNFQHLHSAFERINQLENLNSTVGPFMYPLLKEGSFDIRQKLARGGIYIPTLWPNVLEDCSKDSCAYYFAENILPLPIDQRYGDEEMDILISAVTDALRG